MILYLPALYSNREQGSEGAIIEIDAEAMMAMQNVRAGRSNSAAVSMVTGNTTRAAAALLIGCVIHIQRKQHHGSQQQH